MGLDFDYTLDQTPLDEDEKEGLLIPTIATLSDCLYVMICKLKMNNKN